MAVPDDIRELRDELKELRSELAEVKTAIAVMSFRLKLWSVLISSAPPLAMMAYFFLSRVWGTK